MSLEIKVPTLGESVSEAVIARWAVSDGDAVKADAVIAELETDKAMMEIMAETAGVVRIKTAAGATVKVGQVIGQLEPGAAGIKASASAPASAVASVPSTTLPTHTQALSPAVRRIVEEQKIDPAQVAGTGKDGRLTKADVLTHQATPTSAVVAPTAGTIPAMPAHLAVGGGESRQRRVPMTAIRRKIAERLLQSQQNTASLTTFNEIDMSAVMELRKNYKEVFEKKHGSKLGFMSFFSRAAIMALQDVPAVNAFIDGDSIVYNDNVNLGIAVGTPRGLMVPVLKNAERMGLWELEAEIARFGAKARDGKITPDDLMGGTFTISNGGVYGSLMSTPILNPPQSGILGLHKIEDRAVVVKGQIVVRPMMYVALSYDHRLVDGEQAVTFLVRVKERIEDPARMLLAI